MANKTSIEWVRTYSEDGTFEEGYSVNPIRFRPYGSERLTTMCQKVSPGCTHCYAATIVQRFWPKSANVSFPGYTAQGVASGQFMLDEKHLMSVLKIKKPSRIFWGDMTDMFQESVPDHMIDMCLAVCAVTPHLTHMFLTKRPERLPIYLDNLKSVGDAWSAKISKPFSPSDVLNLRWMHWRVNHGPAFPYGPWPLPNVMLGTSAENQECFDKRMPHIQTLEELGWKTFLSLEPLLGPINVEYPKSIYPDGPTMCCNGHECGCKGMPNEPPMIFKTSQVIVGAESGHGARSMDEDWVRRIRDSCLHWKVPFFYKQKIVNGKKVGLPELDGKVYAEFPEQ